MRKGLQFGTYGNCTLTKPIAEGGMGVVWQGNYESPDMRRTVAVKFCTKGNQDRFFREAKLQQSIDHPNLVKVYEWGETLDGTPYMIMELMRTCGTLTDMINANRESDFHLTRPMYEHARKLVEPVRYLHKKGILHRDIKPGNILVGGTFKLTDLGISRDLEETDRLTVKGNIMGTLDYMSPEQANGEDATVASDQYSLGMMLYEYLTTHHPRPKKGDETQWNYIARITKPGPLGLKRHELPKPILQMLKKMTAFEPGERYLSLDEPLAILKQASDEIPAPTIAEIDCWSWIWKCTGILAAGSFAYLIYDKF